jgi:DNA-directed RNA polymerase specialized sigma24 family protein
MLQSFYGRSRLLIWLQTVATHQMIDLRRRKSRTNCEWDLLDQQPPQPTSSPADEVILRGQLETVRSLIASAFGRLLTELRESAVTQYEFAYYRCVKGLSYTEVAERLAVTKSRVTELSTLVCGKLMSIFRRLEPEFAEKRSEISKEQRKLIEEAIYDWFSGGANAGLTADELGLKSLEEDFATVPVPREPIG